MANKIHFLILVFVSSIFSSEVFAMDNTQRGPTGLRKSRKALWDILLQRRASAAEEAEVAACVQTYWNILESDDSLEDLSQNVMEVYLLTAQSWSRELLPQGIDSVAKSLDELFLKFQPDVDPLQLSPNPLLRARVFQGLAVRLLIWATKAS